MPEAVVATQTATQPVPSSTPEGGALRAPKQQQSNAEESRWSINEPTAEEVTETKSMNEIIDKATGKAGKSSKEANLVPETQGDEQKQPAEPPKKQKYTFEGKEVEIDDDHAKRLVQKGMLFDKKGFEIAKYEKGVRAREEAAAQQELKVAAILEELSNPESIGEVLEQLLGPEKARLATEAYLRPKIEREMLPPEQQQQLTLQEENARLKAQLDQHTQQQKQTKEEAETSQWVENYQQTIVKALDLGGVPRTDFTAAEMAGWMQRGLDKGIEYAPEQLAQFVKEDNILRVGALTNSWVSEVNEGRKTGDNARIVKAGEALADMFGEPVMFAIGKYYLARTKTGQPQQPKQILDTPKVKPVDPTPKKRHYMSEDEVTAERKRRVQMMAAGQDPGEWD